MAIVAGDVKLYESVEMSDEDTSGGLMDSTQITCGGMNNLFPNISRLDRLHGRVQFRKVYVKINSQNTDTYSGSHIALSELPEDPETTVIFFEAADHPEERSDLMSVVEDYFDVGESAGDAQCTFPVKYGSHSISFQIESIDRKTTTGGGWYTKPSWTDWSRSLDVNVGDVIFIDDGSYSEFVQVSRIETTEQYSIYNPYRQKGVVYKHLYTVEEIQAGGVGTSYGIGWTANRTVRKDTWKAYGSFLVTQDITAGDHTIYVGNTNTRLIPTTYGIAEIYNDKFLPLSNIADDIEVGPTGMTWDQDNVRQPWHADYKVASEGQATYAMTLEFPPIVEESVKIWIRHNNKWEYMVDDGLGSFTADSFGTGSVSYTTGTISWTCESVPDYPSDFIIMYQMEILYAENENITIGSAGALPRTLAFGETNIVTDSIRIEYDAGGKTWRVKDDGDGNLIINYQDWLSSTAWTLTQAVIGAANYYNVIYWDEYHSVFWNTASTTIHKSSDGLSWASDTDPAGTRTNAPMTTSLNTGRQVLGASQVTETDLWYRDGGAGAWTAVAMGFGPMVFGVVWVDGTGHVGSDDYFIFVGDNGKIFYSTDGTAWTEVDFGTQDWFLVCVDATRQYVMVYGGTLGNECMFYDRADGPPSSGNWTSRIGFALGKQPYESCCTTYEGTRYWVVAGDQMSLQYSDDDGVTWVSSSITYIGAAWAGTTDLTGCGSDDNGHVLVMGDQKSEYLASYDGGQTFTERDESNFSALYDTYSGAAWDATNERFLCWGGSAGGIHEFTNEVEVPVMSGLTDDRVGDVDYAAGTGNIDDGLAPTSIIEAVYFLSDKAIESINVQFNGADDIVQNTLKIRAGKLSDTTDVMTIEESGGAITGDGSGTLDKDNGTFIGDFDYAFDPDTLSMDYSFDAILSTEFTYNYDEIDRSVFPPDGFVPGVKTGDTLLITDGTNEDLVAVQTVYPDRIVTLQAISNAYTAATPTHVSNCVLFGDLQAQESLNFDQQSWDTTTWQDTVQGSPATATYDFTTYPLVIDNEGAATERWGIYITSVTTPDLLYVASIYSENHGVIATGQDVGTNAAADLAPVNPATTPAVYWSLDKDGWGGSWAVGNLLRFNTDGCDPPVWVVRVINAKSSTQTTDDVELEIRGDVA